MPVLNPDGEVIRVPGIEGSLGHHDGWMGSVHGNDPVGEPPKDLLPEAEERVLSGDPPSDGHRIKAENGKRRIRTVSLRAFLSGGAITVVYAFGAISVMNVSEILRHVGFIGTWLVISALMGVSGFIAYFIWLLSIKDLDK